MSSTDSVDSVTSMASTSQTKLAPPPSSAFDEERSYRMLQYLPKHGVVKLKIGTFIQWQ